ncbi:5'-nucleotidase [Carpediemonas membranifera]|uniref:5'-nucleotidase n=1 Tax=Carpediemonas membranifera TaxID=201153 RepID=A0A8J6AZ56_9EUKA|nr:5'-nucleotidase [Carpediemonas membranifera]|eukprot:KAG9389522.1 5'-nucleotidase [Carpediemonas membranifera]
MKLLLVSLLLICVLGTPMTGTVRLWQTSDVHGWIDGHPHMYKDAGLADFLGLVETEKTAVQNDETTEFLLLDSGDQVQGTGFSDATDIDGSFIYAMMKHLPYDGMTVGNHELGLPDTVKMLHDHASDLFTESDLYVTTNTIWGSNKGESQEDMKPLGQTRYRTMTLKKFDMKVIIFGWMYNFSHDIDGAFVVDAVKTINSDWFKAVIEKEKPDFVINLNHIATSDHQNNNIYLAQRALMPDTPLLLLTGHSHQFRHANCIAADGSTDPQCFMSEPMCYLYMFVEMDLHFTRASGKWQWADLPSPKSVEATKAAFKSVVGDESITTSHSKAMQTEIDTEASELHLNKVMGCSDKTYYRSQAPEGYGSAKSFIGFFQGKVMPQAVYPDDGANYVSFFNSGILRANLYEGQVVQEDIYTIAPFPDPFKTIKVSGSDIKQLLKLDHGYPYDSDLVSENHHEVGVGLGMAPSFGYTPLPHYILSIGSSEIVEDKDYVLFCDGYDSVAFLERLNKHGESAPYTADDFHPATTVQTALEDYMSKYMSC